MGVWVSSGAGHHGTQSSFCSSFWGGSRTHRQFQGSHSTIMLCPSPSRQPPLAIFPFEMIQYWGSRLWLRTDFFFFWVIFLSGLNVIFEFWPKRDEYEVRTGKRSPRIFSRLDWREEERQWECELGEGMTRFLEKKGGEELTGTRVLQRHRETALAPSHLLGKSPPVWREERGAQTPAESGTGTALGKFNWGGWWKAEQPWCVRSGGYGAPPWCHL